MSYATGRIRSLRREGFTLVEMTMAMAVMSILAVGIATAMISVTRAIPDDQSPIAVQRASMEALHRIEDELSFASSVSAMSATSMTFTVPDRNHGAPGPETIAYQWSGTLGSPLMMQYNGQPEVSVVDDVYGFQLTYHTETEAQSNDTIESAETTLAAYTTASLQGDYALTDKDWIGQYVTPTLPPDAISWRVTRVKVLSRIHGATNGITAVQLRRPTIDSLPSLEVFGECAMYESSLTSTYLWQEFSFQNVAGLSPSEGLCLVLTLQQSDTHLADVAFDSIAGTGRLETSNAENGWLKSAPSSMLYTVFGTVTTPNPNPPPPQSFLTGVTLLIQVGPLTSGRLQTEVQTLNAPEVTGL